jgi:hypothetical protein
MEVTSNYSKIATVFQNHGFHESSYIKSCDSNPLTYSGQDDKFVEFFPGEHILDSTADLAEPKASQAFTMADNISPTTSQWQYKESDSPIWRMSSWPTSSIL